MSRGKTIAQWVESQGDKCAGVRIQLGSRATGTTVGIVEVEGRGLEMNQTTIAYSSPVDQLARTLEDLALESGWGSALGQESVLRLYSLDKKGKPITTYQKTAKAQPSAGQVTDIHALAMEHRRAMDKALDTICEQARTNTRTIDILTETLAHREGLMAHTLEAYLESAQDATETRAANIMLESALDNGEQADSLRSMQGQVLQQVMGLLGGGAPPGEGEQASTDDGLTAEQIYKAMSENPMLRFNVSKLFDTPTEHPATDEG